MIRLLKKGVPEKHRLRDSGGSVEILQTALEADHCIDGDTIFHEAVFIMRYLGKLLVD